MLYHRSWRIGSIPVATLYRFSNFLMYLLCGGQITAAYFIITSYCGHHQFSQYTEQFAEHHFSVKY